jgi:regulator of protease activity HflC (stomatin/prohibitin superfamily)
MQGLMGEFPDINESINALLSYAEQMRQRKRLEAQKAEMQAKNEQARREAEAKQAQAKAQEQAYMASPYFNSPLKQFMQTKALLDSNTFPGTPNTFFQNFPATSALMYGKNVFPSGWDAYAQLAQAGGPMSAAAINTAGENWRHITPGANPYPTSSGGGR